MLKELKDLFSFPHLSAKAVELHGHRSTSTDLMILVGAIILLGVLLAIFEG